MQSNCRGFVPAEGYPLQQEGGQLAWAGGLLPWIRSFNANLCAASVAHPAKQAGAARPSSKRSLAGCSTKKRPMHLFFARRLMPAIGLVRKFFYGFIVDGDCKSLALGRWFSVGHWLATEQFRVRTDPSPFRLGAILLWRGAPTAWMALLP